MNGKQQYLKGRIDSIIDDIVYKNCPKLFRNMSILESKYEICAHNNDEVAIVLPKRAIGGWDFGKYTLANDDNYEEVAIQVAEEIIAREMMTWISKTNLAHRLYPFPISTIFRGHTLFPSKVGRWKLCPLRLLASKDEKMVHPTLTTFELAEISEAHYKEFISLVEDFTSLE